MESASNGDGGLFGVDMSLLVDVVDYPCMSGGLSLEKMRLSVTIAATLLGTSVRHIGTTVFYFLNSISWVPYA